MNKLILFKQYAYRYLIIAFMPIMMLSCSDEGGVNLYSVSDDVTIGSQIDSELKLENNKAQYPIYNNAEMQAYLQDIVNEIAKSNSINYSEVFNYNVQIINDLNTVNAFATAGGYVYVYTGLLKFAQNKAELASVIAHEMAHNDRRHSTKRMTTEYGIGLLAQIVLGQSPAQWEAILANIASNLGILKNSRDDEYEADKYAYMYLKDTKYYPAGMKYFFNRVLETEQSAGGERPSSFQMLFATHPYSKDRVVAVEEFEKADNIPAPIDATIFQTEYSAFKNKFGL